MATTTPDGIRYPSDYEAPADIPNDLQNLATDVQTALNTKMDAAASSSLTLSNATGWADHKAVAHKFGKMIVLSSFFARSGNLDVVANTGYPIGTLPGSYRPAVNEYLPCVWSDGTRRAGTIHIAPADGVITFYPFAAGSLVVGDYVSLAGIVFVTA